MFYIIVWLETQLGVSIVDRTVFLSETDAKKYRTKYEKTFPLMQVYELTSDEVVSAFRKDNCLFVPIQQNEHRNKGECSNE